MQHFGGRERRRKDLVGRLRRMAYGFMLWTAVPAAHAADETGGRRLQNLLGNIGSHIGASLGPKHLSFSPPEPESSLFLEPDAKVRTLLSFRFETELDILRKGAGFDLALPQVGYLYLNLYTPKDDAGSHGKRWKLHDEQLRRPAPLWFIGGTVDLVRDNPDASRQVNINPQMVLDLDGIFGMDSECEANIQYANWKGLGEDAPVGRVPQVTVKWRF